MWGSDFRGSERNFTIGQRKAPKFGVIFQKYSLKFGKIIEKIRENANFSEIFIIFGNYGNNFITMGTIRNIIWLGFSGGFAGGAERPLPEVRNFSKKFLEICHGKY